MDLIKYDEAKKAIAEYQSVDEVKDFRDKTLAIQAYAKQANDFELERGAALARVRAERRCGQLLKETKMNKGYKNISKSGGPTVGPPETVQTLSELGINKNQSSRWQKLADIPDDEFEDKVNLPGALPSTNHLLREESEPTERIDLAAMNLWGRLTDLEKKYFEQPLEGVIDKMTDPMKTDMLRVIPKLKRWLNNYER